MEDIQIGKYTVSKDPDDGEIVVSENGKLIGRSYSEVIFGDNGKEYIAVSNKYWFGEQGGITVYKAVAVTEEN